MTDRLDLDGFERQIEAFSERVRELRNSTAAASLAGRGPDGHEPGAAPDESGTGEGRDGTAARRAVARVRERRDGHPPNVDRSARADGTAAALEAALLELEVAEEELHVARDELLAQRTRLDDPAAERERRLLRAMVGELPVPVFLLERDGIVRRANRAACELVETPAA